MLSKEENELLTRVGPGTPMGELMRRYWMPTLMTSDLPGPDCAPVRVRLLGEDLVAFRDTDGRAGLLDEFCAHRCASLFLGRNEENGLRCVYHGWKFDVDGRCVDLPTEPAHSTFKDRIHLKAYPIVEVGGVIWSYMGPSDRRPGPPAFEWTRAAPDNRFVSKTLEQCSYLQAVEGGIDPTHGAFLHNNNIADRDTVAARDPAARIELERTTYGYRYAGIRDTGGGDNYIRIRHFVLPFHQLRPDQTVRASGGGTLPIPQVRGHMWVPIDDENTWVFNWIFASDPDRPFTREFVLSEETKVGRGPEGEVGAIRRRTRANNWLIDREMQRTTNFTGIQGTNTQDLAAQESMGPIIDRRREHLGSSDQAIITLRQILLEAVSSVQEGGDAPGAEPETYRMARPADVVLPHAVRWQDAVQEKLVAVY